MLVAPPAVTFTPVRMLAVEECRYPANVERSTLVACKRCPETTFLPGDRLISGGGHGSWDERDPSPSGATSARTTTHTSTPPQRIELNTRAERRRRWSVDQKRAIVAESYTTETSALATARKYAISSVQLYLWHSQLRGGELASEDATSCFVRVSSAAAAPRRPGLIEIVLAQGVVLRV